MQMFISSNFRNLGMSQGAVLCFIGPHPFLDWNAQKSESEMKRQKCRINNLWWWNTLMRLKQTMTNGKSLGGSLLLWYQILVGVCVCVCPWCNYKSHRQCVTDYCFWLTYYMINHSWFYTNAVHNKQRKPTHSQMHWNSEFPYNVPCS